METVSVDGDSALLHKLFRENTELRHRCNALQRELYNKAAYSETVEEELRQLKIRLESGERASSVTPNPQSSKKTTRAAGELTAASTNISVTKELQEALFSLERKNAELKQLKEDLVKHQLLIDEKTQIIERAEKEALELRTELFDLRNFKATAIKETEVVKPKPEQIVPVDVVELKLDIEAKDAIIAQLKKQAVDIALEANRKHNEQQNQLQGVEALIEGIRKEYDEFIQITKLETEAFRNQQTSDYKELKEAFEAHKIAQFEEKKRLMTEYSSLLYSMQSQFEEYRTSAEYMFNTEILKLEDELSLQSLRYEHEIMYVIQAKDKFYAEMMVSKDAKIMNLIEGSDMQTLMQKHELDIENLRKEHAREIERVKSDQESEQKNLIGLLQRQNVSLESKCEKLQTHLKTLEVRIRELMGTIDNKVKMLNDREELRLKTESEYEIKLADANARISALNQEKEHLRHKVIRLNLNAKGEGENSIENMLKRITRETADLHVEFEHLSSRHDTLVGENQVLVRRLKEREKFAEFLEKEVTRRTEEYISMTRTFEEFLSARARQSRKEKAAKLSSIFEDDANGHHSTYAMDIKKSKLPKKPTLVQTFIPAKGQEIVDLQASAREAKAMESARKMELERGYNYLKKFKTLSRAFATGDFRIIPSHQYDATLQSSSGPWQKTQLYGRLDDANAAMARLYREPTKELWDNSSKPAVYLDPRQAPREDQTEDSEVKVYEQRVNTAVPVPAATAPASPAKRSSEELRVGGTPALRRYPL